MIMLRRAKDRQAALERGEYVQPRWRDWQDHRRESAIWQRMKEDRVPGCRLTNHEIRMESLFDKVVYEKQELSKHERFKYNNSIEQYARARFSWELPT
jgi:hypothetical protein